MLVKLCLLILFEIDLHNLLTSPPTYTLGWECFPLTPTSGPPRYTRGWGCLICVGQTEECQQPKIVLILWFYSLLYTHLDRCAEWAGQVNRPGQGWIKSHFPVLFRTDSFRTSIDSFRICTSDIQFWSIYKGRCQKPQARKLSPRGLHGREYSEKLAEKVNGKGGYPPPLHGRSVSENGNFFAENGDFCPNSLLPKWSWIQDLVLLRVKLLKWSCFGPF